MQTTIRELCGEIWAEWEMRRRAGIFPFDERCKDWEQIHRLIDLSMAVMARHDGTYLVNDEDLPVTPLPPMERTS